MIKRELAAGMAELSRWLFSLAQPVGLEHPKGGQYTISLVQGWLNIVVLKPGLERFLLGLSNSSRCRGTHAHARGELWSFTLEGSSIPT